jgi:hypothetical protein
VVHRVGRGHRPPPHGAGGCAELVPERILAPACARGTSHSAHDRCFRRRARSVPSGARHSLRSALDRCPADAARGPRAPTGRKPYPRGSRPIPPRPAPGAAPPPCRTDRGQVGLAPHARPGRGAGSAVAGERAAGRTIPVCRRRGRCGCGRQRERGGDRGIPRPRSRGRSLADRRRERERRVERGCRVAGPSPRARGRRGARSTRCALSSADPGRDCTTNPGGPPSGEPRRPGSGGRSNCAGLATPDAGAGAANGAAARPPVAGRARSRSRNAHAGPNRGRRGAAGGVDGAAGS